MQIKMFMGNSVNVAFGRAAQEKRQSVQAQQGGIFDSPQCKVTISKEGRKLSGQSDRQYTQKSAQSLKTEKMMQRQQKESEQPDETLSEYSDLLEEINKTIRSMQNSNMTDGDKEALKKRQQVINAIGDQKQKQVEENQKKAKEAQQMAMQSSKMQDEIDENNQDLYVMLKSIEESEKAEEEREGGKTQEGGDNSDNKTENSVIDSIQNSALRFATSSMKREMNVVGMIDALREDGYQYLARADEIAQNAFAEAQSVEKLFQDENYTDAEKKEAVISYGNKMGRGSSDDLEILLSKYRTEGEKKEALERYHMAMKRNSDFSDYRRSGMQMVRDAKECKSDHVALNPLQGMEQTRDSMMQSAVDAAFNEASQGKLDEASQELEDRVKELIDERNDIDRTEPEEDEEKQKEIEELPKAEEDKENRNAADEEQDRITQGLWE